MREQLIDSFMIQQSNRNKKEVVDQNSKPETDDSAAKHKDEGEMPGRKRRAPRGINRGSS